MRQLLLSSSRVGHSGYLESALDAIAAFGQSVSGKVVFVPYAGVTVDFDAYHQMVLQALAPLNIRPQSIHLAANKKELLNEAELLLVGGGNTFALLKRLQQEELLPIIRERCQSDLAYIGWSAGSNITAPTICTTNDMPIVEPESFNALGLLPFQINPHYIHGNPPGHNGETRQQRIEEYLAMNPSQKVVALPEGCWLHRENDSLTFQGCKPGLIFCHQQPPQEISPDSDLSQMINQAS